MHERAHSVLVFDHLPQLRLGSYLVPDYAAPYAAHHVPLHRMAFALRLKQQQHRQHLVAPSEDEAYRVKLTVRLTLNKVALRK